MLCERATSQVEGGIRPARNAGAVVLVIILLVLPAAAAARRPAGGPGRSAVLFIGDGMGPAYVTATRVARGGSAGRLHVDDMPYTAIVRTFAADGPVTDSAAAVTAMACGRKTVNGVLGEDASAVYGKSDGKKLEPLGLWAEGRGMRVGLVTTTRVTHATPAGFYATVNDRDRERTIARQAIASSVDLLLGGGREFFRPGPRVSGDPGWPAGDSEDLEALARSRGFTIVTSGRELAEVASLETKVLGLFADSHMPYEAPAGRAGDRAGTPSLVEMTRWAIARLRATGRPFFLMVEGGRIDHAGHANWARTLVDETAAFDDAIGAALVMLDPKATLVLVTADHETGGLAINGYPEEKNGILGTVRPEGGGDPYPVLTFATGPGSKTETPDAPYGSADGRPSAVKLGSAAHTGVDVTLYGWGADAEEVRGTLDNTAVYALLRAHLEGRRPDRASLERPPR